MFAAVLLQMSLKNYMSYDTELNCKMHTVTYRVFLIKAAVLDHYCLCYI